MAFSSYDDLIKASGIKGYDFRAKGAIPGIHTLYCARMVPTSVAANINLEFFHKGIGDDMANFGGTSGTNATFAATNLQKEGRLPDGELFICTGVSFQLPHNLPVADLLLINDGEVAWSENANTRKRVLGQFEEFPAQVRSDYILRGVAIGTPSGNEERLVRSSGRAFISGAPLFTIRGGVTQHEQGQLNLKFAAAITPSAAFSLKCRLYGVHFQIPQGT